MREPTIRRIVSHLCIMAGAVVLPFAPRTAGANDDNGEVASTPSAAPRHRGAFYVDPLGFLLFGPNVGAEVALGPVGLGATFRWFSPGLLGKALFLRDDAKFTFSYGLGLNAQYYFLSSLAGPHVGLAAEYLRVGVKDETERYKTASSYIVPQLQGGYRYGWKRWFIGGVAGVGYAARLSSKIEDLDTGGSPTGAYVENESSFYGSARLDLGVYF